MLALSKEQIVDIMLQLYDASKEANAWLEFHMEPNCDAELKKYKKSIRNQFFGRNDWPKDPSFRECNKLITAFKKLIPDPHATADLMLYYVEQGCCLTAQFGDYDDPFYTALENNFNKGVKFISSYGLMSGYSPRMKNMIESVECCGWGFPDTLWVFITNMPKINSFYHRKIQERPNSLSCKREK